MPMRPALRNEMHRPPLCRAAFLARSGNLYSCARASDQQYYCRRSANKTLSAEERGRKHSFEIAIMNVPITFACGLYAPTLPLYTGEVKPAGIDLTYQMNEEPRDIFDKMAGEQAYGASEMSASEPVCRIAANQC